ncbi:MAG: hypothetical protein BVN29_03150 [Nitrospira sp. ST-bin5]|nr:MAG: hypothetical protein BVN29_03150 [Nitrospira sp. ST-bin5]
MTALERDPGLRGHSPAATATRLNISEEELGALIVSGALNVADIYEDGEIVNIIIPDREIQRYAAKAAETAL